MIDIHTHIIPRIDDGSDSRADSLAMARMAAESGVTALVATPHCNMEGYYDNFNSGDLVRAFADLSGLIREEGIPLEVLPGMEIYYSQDLPRKIKEKEVIGLNHSRYYLVEFPFDISASRMQRNLNELLQMEQVIPVIAHPERYYCVQRDPQVLYSMVMDGCLTQVNKGSIAGKFGEEPFVAAMELLEYNLVGCVASDAHTPYMRTTHMRDVYLFLQENYSTEYARLMLKDNPGRMIENRRVDMRAVARPVRKRYFR
ncbi:MAG: tyrosine-protein phosphatase [Hominisplanchenecus sp.]